MISPQAAPHDALRPIAIDDLLGRDEVQADPQLGPGIRDAVVCVTGAGGSIVRSSAARSCLCRHRD